MKKLTYLKHFRLREMDHIDKKTLSERDICTKYITPAIYQAGWDIHTQVREEVTFTNGRVIVQGLQVSRGRPKRADYILYYTGCPTII